MNLIQEIELFMRENHKIILQLSDINWIRDLAFLVDIIEHLNNLNSKLQGKNQLITQMAHDINLFQAKLHLWRIRLKIIISPI